MKKLFATWRWSLTVVARSPVSLLACAVVSALWGVGAYQWLWLPESSALILLASLVWALALIFVAVSVLAGTAAAASAAVANDAPPMGRLAFMTVQRKFLGPTLLALFAAAPLFLALVKVFNWVNRHALELASFLTFHAEKPVSYQVIGKIFWWIEALVWVVICGFLLSFLITLLGSGGKVAWSRIGRTLASCCFRAPFWTSLASVVVFGGLSWLLATWHPKVPPGFWDYSQMVLRLGTALFLLVIGWFFWMLSLARVGRESSYTISEVR